jgi:methylated-DNA-protein-cysteine methyltransferase related protein
LSYSESTIIILSILKQLPAGKVISYGEVAKLAGYPNGARQVVRILSSLSDAERLPWHRVVNKQGQIALSGEGAFIQKALLEAEGVVVSDEGKIDRRYFLK